MTLQHYSKSCRGKKNQTLLYSFQSSFAKSGCFQQAVFQRINIIVAIDHKIYYKDNTLLFLLAVVDSVDPIKFFCRDGRYRKSVSPQDVISNFYVGFSCETRAKKLLLKYETSLFDKYVTVLNSSDNGMSSWLGVRLSFHPGEGILEISIDTKNQLRLAS